MFPIVFLYICVLHSISKRANIICVIKCLVSCFGKAILIFFNSFFYFREIFLVIFWYHFYSMQVEDAVVTTWNNLYYLSLKTVRNRFKLYPLLRIWKLDLVWLSSYSPFAVSCRSRTRTKVQLSQYYTLSSLVQNMHNVV